MKSSVLKLTDPTGSSNVSPFSSFSIEKDPFIEPGMEFMKVMDIYVKDVPG